MKKIITLLVALTAVVSLYAQTPLKKVYDETINPLEQIDEAIKKAKAEGKYVVCQVGGNWCPWCLKFADFISNDSTITKIIDDNFVYIHVNYNPRKSLGDDALQNAKQLLERLGHPERFGFPVFVVLNENGTPIHTQDSVFLEEGKGYNREKCIRFFTNWTPAATSSKTKP